MKILEFDTLPSTNDYAKSHTNEGDIIVIAKSQSKGRGSKNRSFHSGMGGLYLTKLTNYQAFPAKDVFQILRNTSIAVCKTLEEFGLTPAIKWPNDIYVQNKKICGILIENTFSGAFLARSIVGIGLNVNNRLPDELQTIAMAGSRIIAENCGNNHFKVYAENVKRFAIYLAPEMGDLTRPFTVDCQKYGSFTCIPEPLEIPEKDYSAKIIIELKQA